MRSGRGSPDHRRLKTRNRLTFERASSIRRLGIQNLAKVKVLPLDFTDWSRLLILRCHQRATMRAMCGQLCRRVATVSASVPHRVLGNLVTRPPIRLRATTAAAPTADWSCADCGDANPATKRECWRCDAARPQRSSPTRLDTGASSPGVRRAVPGGQRHGRWLCSEYHGENFADRIECFRCNVPRQAGSMAAQGAAEDLDVG